MSLDRLGPAKIQARLDELGAKMAARLGEKETRAPAPKSAESFDSKLQGNIGGMPGLAPMKVNGLGLEPVGGDPIQLMIDRVSQEEGVDANLIRSIVEQESGFNPMAVSGKGAKGLMQLMPLTAQSLGVRDAFDPEQNVRGGSKYIRQLIQQFGGDLNKAVAAYNAGPGNVNKYGGIPPFRETQDYVQKVLGRYEGLRGKIGGG